MAARQTLREYLVGIKADPQGFTELNRSLDVVGKKLAGIAKLATEAFAGLATATTVAAKRMEDLYFQADRARTSAENLFVVGKAAEQVGVSADDAASAVQVLATNIRMADPATTRFFSFLGFKPGGDASQNLLNLLKAFQGVPEGTRLYGMAATRIGDMTGLSEPSIHMFLSHMPEFEASLKQQQKMAADASVNVNKIAEQSHGFMQSVRNLFTNSELFGMKGLEKALPTAKATADYLDDMATTLHSIDSKIGGWGSLIGTGLLAGGGAVAGGALLRRLLGGAATAGEGLGAGLAAGGLAAAGVGLFDAIMGVKVFKQARQLYDAYAKSGDVSGIAQFIARFEGKSNSLYRDAGGKLTIGYGHLVREGEDFSRGVSDSGALNLFRRDLAPVIAAVQRLVKVPLNANQFKALSDFAFNVGIGGFAGSTLLKKLNAGDFAGAANEFTKWDKVQGQTNLGNLRRRMADRDLFEKPVVNQSVEQNNEVHIHGVTDPQQAAAAVQKQQRKADGQLFRNLAQGNAF